MFIENNYLVTDSCLGPYTNSLHIFLLLWECYFLRKFKQGVKMLRDVSANFFLENICFFNGKEYGITWRELHKVKTKQPVPGVGNSQSWGLTWPSGSFSAAFSLNLNFCEVLTWMRGRTWDLEGHMWLWGCRCPTPFCSPGSLLNVHSFFFFSLRYNSQTIKICLFKVYNSVVLSIFIYKVYKH